MFSGSEALRELLVHAVREAPPGLAPIDAAAAGVEAVCEFFAGRHERARLYAGLIAAHAELQERELIKMAALRSALASALGTRGVAEPTASLTADLGMAVFQNAFARWVSGPPDRTVAEVAREALRELKAVAAGT
jgi:hypothetical protein